MKQLEDFKTLELPIPSVDALPVAPKRGRGRPVTGLAMTPAQRQKAFRDRLKASGGDLLNVQVSKEVTDALAKFVAFKDMTLGDAVDRILRDRLLRKR